MPGRLDTSLIEAKLTAPALPPGAIDRPRVRVLLDAAAQVKVGLVVAPAGFGKTVAVTQWLSASATAAPPAPPEVAAPPAVAWLTLGQHDDHPARFWTYVLAALTRAGIPAQPWADALVQAAGDESPGPALAPLLNALAAQDCGMILVLDNCHLISDPRIHSALAFLVDNQPPSFHLIALTRHDPPFVAARWAASGQLAQIRARDLAFSDAEASAFLAGQAVALPPDQAGPLLDRLHGWPAALRLATLWLAGRDDTAAALAEFAGSDATIADYLTTEVLSQLPGRLRRFLLQTSILPQLTGSLCEAVTGQGGGAATLARLQRSGLFTEAAGLGQDWFRYHDLFRELLELELHRTRPREVPRLHQRAAAWLAGHGYTSEAITHSLAASDWPGAQSLIFSEVLAISSRYHPAVMEGWLAALPAPVLQDSQVFLVVHGYVLSQLGRLAESRAAIGQASALASKYGPEPRLPGLGAIREAVACGTARLDCDLTAVQQAWQASAQELAQAGQDGTSLAAMARSATANALAGTLLWHGDLPSARELLAEADRETGRHQLVRMRSNCLAVTALLLAFTGQLTRADALVTEALNLAAAAGVSGMFQDTPARLARAMIAWYRGDHVQAWQHAADAADQARRQADRGPLLLANVLLARLAISRGDLAQAHSLLAQPAAAFPGWVPPPALRALLTEEMARAHLRSGDIPAARAACDQLQALPQQDPLTSVATQLTCARVLNAEGDHAQAATGFGTAAAEAMAHELLPRAIEACVEACVASQATGQTQAALGYLGQALTMACDEEITTPSSQASAAVRPLLLHMERAPDDYPAPLFRRRLLAVTGGPAEAPGDHHRAAPLPAGLSNRERAVLRLLHGTLNNAEMAAALSVSPNTLKTHIRNLYRKLGVTTRAQAVARTRGSGW